MPGTILNVAEVFCTLKKEASVIMTQNKNSYDIYIYIYIYIQAIYDVYCSFLTYCPQ